MNIIYNNEENGIISTQISNRFRGSTSFILYSCFTCDLNGIYCPYYKLFLEIPWIDLSNCEDLIGKSEIHRACGQKEETGNVQRT